MQQSLCSRATAAEPLHTSQVLQTNAMHTTLIWSTWPFLELTEVPRDWQCLCTRGGFAQSPHWTLVVAWQCSSFEAGEVPGVAWQPSMSLP